MNLIYDIGFHKGEDTSYYLQKGYRVIAVDADITLINEAKEKFADFIRKGQLILLNYAITEQSNQEIEFHISSFSLWNSVHKKISGREGKDFKTVKVPTKRLDDLFIEFGVPVYAKIDIEGNDNICLQSLKTTTELPKYISVETECIGDDDILKGEELYTLNSLYELGYRKFKLIDQHTLTVLNHKKFFYNGYQFFSSTAIWVKVLRKLKILHPPISWNQNQKQRLKYEKDLGYVFLKGSTGPFGEEIAGKWVNYTTAKKLLCKHRKDVSKFYGKERSLWCDWHATL